MAVVMLTLWVGMVTLSAVPQLHQLLHQDLRSADHHCVITQLGDRSLLCPVGAVVAPTRPALTWTLAQTHALRLSTGGDRQLPPGRAPPPAVFPSQATG